MSTYQVPPHCTECGEAFPWTRAAFEAAEVLVYELDGLDEVDREMLKNSLPGLIRDTSETPVAIARFKRILKKTEPTALDAFKEILVNVVSETVRKTMFGV
jgi:hypothetical protein